jgi:hypothetical protein
MYRHLNGLIARQYGLITRAQALAHGLSSSAIDRRLASGEWIRVYRGVYRMAATPVTWQQELLAVCLREPGQVWASHRAAAGLWRLDDCEPGQLEVTTTSGMHSEGSLVVHRVKRMPSSDVTLVGNFPATTVHRTLMDLGAVLSADAVEIAFESALRRGISDANRIGCHLAAFDRRGPRGPGVIRAIIDRHDGRSTGSALEIKFTQLLRRHRLPRA